MKQYQPLLDKVRGGCSPASLPLTLDFSPQRRDVVSGVYEPTDEECQWAEEESAEGKGQLSTKYVSVIITL